MTKKELLLALADYVCLGYHEARNVRGKLKDKEFEFLRKYIKLEYLAKNRNTAWEQMAKTRQLASQQLCAQEALAVFEKEYGFSLDDLIQLYEAEGVWRDHPYGGNPWATICSRVRDLAGRIDSQDEESAIELTQVFGQLRHHTGSVKEKLKSLRTQQSGEL